MSHTTVVTTERDFDEELTAFNASEYAYHLRQHRKLTYRCIRPPGSPKHEGHARVFDDDFPEFVTLQNSLASLETRVGSLEIDKKKAKTTEKDVSERLTRLEDSGHETLEQLEALL